MMLPMLRLLCLLFAGLLGACACATKCPAPAPASTVEPQLARSAPSSPLSLPANWRNCGAWDFEQLVAGLPLGTWPVEPRAELASALAGPGETSVRAALLLAHGGNDSAEVLLARLEARAPEPERAGDAAEVVAAAALAGFPSDATRERLRALACGPEPHPDLEIRVECASVALDLGQRDVAPFLLRVLHAGTPGERDDPIDWSRVEKLAWTKGRAAAALSRAAGLPNRYRADGSWTHQAEEARALALALGIEP